MADLNIARINELYHKSKTVGLTDAEKKEQQILRRAYIAAMKKNVRAQLDNVQIKEKDGSITDVGERHRKKIQKGN